MDEAVSQEASDMDEAVSQEASDMDEAVSQEASDIDEAVSQEASDTDEVNPTCSEVFQKSQKECQRSEFRISNSLENNEKYSACMEMDASFNKTLSADEVAMAKDILKNRTSLFPRSKGPGKLHQLAEKIYECEQCGKCFTRSFTLKEHRRVHTGERPFHCTECSKTFVSNGDLAKHQKIHSGERNHICPICGKTFIMGGDLVKHLKVHTGDRDYVCSVCGKGFNKNGNLTQHMRSHSGERPYTCTECGVNFTTRYHLKRHMVRHTEMGGKFKCKECGKCFPENGYLRRHFRVHSGEKPFKCSVCDRGFSHKAALQKHLERHDKAKGKLTCGTCGVEFKDKNLLYIHKMTVHLGKTPIPTVHDKGEEEEEEEEEEKEYDLMQNDLLYEKRMSNMLTCFKDFEGITQVSKVVPEPESCLNIVDHCVFIKEETLSNHEGVPD